MKTNQSNTHANTDSDSDSDTTICVQTRDISNSISIKHIEHKEIV